MNTSELINIIVANRIADMHICMPAKIIKYDYKTRKADVQPGINQKYNDGEVVVLPIIHNVPVVHPAAGGASIIFPVKIGDSVLLMFSEKSLEEWLQDGKQATPDDPRQNDLTDAIALIGLFPFSSPSPAENGADLLIDFSGSKIRLKPNGSLEIVSSDLNITNNNLLINSDLTSTITTPLFEVVGNEKVSGFINSETEFRVDNVKVVGNQQVSIADPTGGLLVIDIQARAAIVSILTAMRVHGLIAT